LEDKKTKLLFLYSLSNVLLLSNLGCALIFILSASILFLLRLYFYNKELEELWNSKIILKFSFLNIWWGLINLFVFAPIFLLCLFDIVKLMVVCGSKSWKMFNPIYVAPKTWQFDYWCNCVQLSESQCLVVVSWFHCSLLFITYWSL
jgi:hypothetical protein